VLRIEENAGMTVFRTTHKQLAHGRNQYTLFDVNFALNKIQYEGYQHTEL